MTVRKSCRRQRNTRKLSFLWLEARKLLSLVYAPETFDVTGDEKCTPADVLSVIDELNSPGSRFIDTNSDNRETPLDALVVISWINYHGVGPVGPNPGMPVEIVDEVLTLVWSGTGRDVIPSDDVAVTKWATLFPPADEEVTPQAMVLQIEGWESLESVSVWTKEVGGRNIPTPMTPVSGSEVVVPLRTSAMLPRTEHVLDRRDFQFFVDTKPGMSGEFTIAVVDIIFAEYGVEIGDTPLVSQVFTITDSGNHPSVSLAWDGPTAEVVVEGGDAVLRWMYFECEGEGDAVITLDGQLLGGRTRVYRLDGGYSLLEWSNDTSVEIPEGRHTIRVVTDGEVSFITALGEKDSQGWAWSDVDII